MANQYRSRLAGGAATGGDALPANVLSGKTFTNDNGPQTGTMINRGAVSGTASPSTPYTIPEGYHNGQGVVTGTAGTPHLKSSRPLAGNTGAISLSCAIGDYISLTTFVGGGPFNPTDVFGTVTGADNVSFYGPSGDDVAATAIYKATSTTVSFNYTNPNKGSAFVFDLQ